MEQRLNNLGVEANQLEQEITLIQRQHSLAQDSLNKYQTLQGNGYVSAAQTQQKQGDLIDIATRLSNQIALQAEHASMANSLATDQVQLQRAAASLQQEIAENRNRKTNLITASQAGTITTLTSQTGQTINGGQVLATLIPSTADAADSASLEAHPYAPSRTAGIVAKG